MPKLAACRPRPVPAGCSDPQTQNRCVPSDHRRGHNFSLTSVPNANGFAHHKLEEEDCG